MEEPLNNGDLSDGHSKEDRPKAKDKEKDRRKSDKKPVGSLKSHWPIKATIITLFLSAFFSLVSEMTASTGNIIVTGLLLLFLVFCGVLFDGIGVAVAACALSPLLAMASKKVSGSKMAIRLVKNAEIVSNICNDVIGDCCGILSGTCTAIVAVKLISSFEDVNQKIITIAISAVVSAITVGGKAYLKNVAINNSKEFVMFTARVLSIFSRGDGKDKKEKKEKQPKK